MNGYQYFADGSFEAMTPKIASDVTHQLRMVNGTSVLFTLPSQ
jgi:hypothetical protein